MRSAFAVLRHARARARQSVYDHTWTPSSVDRPSRDVARDVIPPCPSRFLDPPPFFFFRLPCSDYAMTRCPASNILEPRRRGSGRQIAEICKLEETTTALSQFRRSLERNPAEFRSRPTPIPSLDSDSLASSPSYLSGPLSSLVPSQQQQPSSTDERTALVPPSSRNHPIRSATRKKLVRT